MESNAPFFSSAVVIPPDGSHVSLNLVRIGTGENIVRILGFAGPFSVSDLFEKPVCML